MGIILDPGYLAAQRNLARQEIALHNRLPDNYFWNSLAARRSLNPERFDHFHPYIAPWFKLPPPVPCLPECPVPPPCVPVCHIDPKPCPPIHVVPEPASGALAVIAIGTFLLVKLGAQRL